MKHYHPSSELMRAAEEALRNERRLAAWRLRYERHTNANVIKFPRRRHQYMHTRLPDGPEIA